MVVDPVAGGAVPALDGAAILARTPGLDAVADVVAVDRGLKPASHFDWVDLLDLAATVRRLAADPAIDGLVVVQGTDTIEETSFLLELLGGHAQAHRGDRRDAQRQRAGRRRTAEPARRRPVRGEPGAGRQRGDGRPGRDHRAGRRRDQDPHDGLRHVPKPQPGSTRPDRRRPGRPRAGPRSTPARVPRGHLPRSIPIIVATVADGRPAPRRGGRAGRRRDRGRGDRLREHVARAARGRTAGDRGWDPTRPREPRPVGCGRHELCLPGRRCDLGPGGSAPRGHAWARSRPGSPWPWGSAPAWTGASWRISCRDRHRVRSGRTRRRGPARARPAVVRSDDRDASRRRGADRDAGRVVGLRLGRGDRRRRRAGRGGRVAPGRGGRRGLRGAPHDPRPGDGGDPRPDRRPPPPRGRGDRRAAAGPDRRADPTGGSHPDRRGARPAHRSGRLAAGPRLGIRPMGRLADRGRARPRRAGAAGRPLGSRPPRPVGEHDGPRGGRDRAGDRRSGGRVDPPRCRGQAHRGPPRDRGRARLTPRPRAGRRRSRHGHPGPRPTAPRPRRGRGPRSGRARPRSDPGRCLRGLRATRRSRRASGPGPCLPAPGGDRDSSGARPPERRPARRGSPRASPCRLAEAVRRRDPRVADGGHARAVRAGAGPAPGDGSGAGHLHHGSRAARRAGREGRLGRHQQPGPRDRRRRAPGGARRPRAAGGRVGAGAAGGARPARRVGRPGAVRRLRDRRLGPADPSPGRRGPGASPVGRCGPSGRAIRGARWPARARSCPSGRMPRSSRSTRGRGSPSP